MASGNSQDMELDDLSEFLDFEEPEIKPYIGTCKFFDARKGYGFITPDDSSICSDARGLFVQRSRINSAPGVLAILTVGQKVEFLLHQNKKGRSVAIDVTALGGSSVPQTQSVPSTTLTKQSSSSTFAASSTVGSSVSSLGSDAKSKTISSSVHSSATDGASVPLTASESANPHIVSIEQWRDHLDKFPFRRYTGVVENFWVFDQYLNFAERPLKHFRIKVPKDLLYLCNGSKVAVVAADDDNDKNYTTKQGDEKKERRDDGKSSSSTNANGDIEIFVPIRAEKQQLKYASRTKYSCMLICSVPDAKARCVRYVSKERLLDGRACGFQHPFTAIFIREEDGTDSTAFTSNATSRTTTAESVATTEGPEISTKTSAKASAKTTAKTPAALVPLRLPTSPIGDSIKEADLSKLNTLLNGTVRGAVVDFDPSKGYGFIQIANSEMKKRSIDKDQVKKVNYALYARRDDIHSEQDCPVLTVGEQLQFRVKISQYSDIHVITAYKITGPGGRYAGEVKKRRGKQKRKPVGVVGVMPMMRKKRGKGNPPLVALITSMNQLRGLQAKLGIQDWCAIGSRENDLALKFKKMKIPEASSSSSSSNEFPYCVVCSKYFSSKEQQIEHEKGKRHQAVYASTYRGPLWCHVCDTTFTCEEDQSKHLTGKKHLATKVFLIRKMVNGNLTSEDIIATKEVARNKRKAEKEANEKEAQKRRKLTLSTENDDNDETKGTGDKNNANAVPVPKSVTVHCQEKSCNTIVLFSAFCCNEHKELWLSDEQNDVSNLPTWESLKAAAAALAATSSSSSSDHSTGNSASEPMNSSSTKRVLKRPRSPDESSDTASNDTSSSSPSSSSSSSSAPSSSSQISNEGEDDKGTREGKKKKRRKKGKSGGYTLPLECKLCGVKYIGPAQEAAHKSGRQHQFKLKNPNLPWVPPKKHQYQQASRSRYSNGSNSGYDGSNNSHRNSNYRSHSRNHSSHKHGHNRPIGSFRPPYANHQMRLPPPPPPHSHTSANMKPSSNFGMGSNAYNPFDTPSSSSTSYSTSSSSVYNPFDPSSSSSNNLKSYNPFDTPTSVSSSSSSSSSSSYREHRGMLHRQHHKIASVRPPPPPAHQKVAAIAPPPPPPHQKIATVAPPPPPPPPRA